VVFDRFTLADLQIPVLGAPMAGGPSTPELAAAVSNAGGLGFLAAGPLSAEELADAILVSRGLTSGPLGVDLFVPRKSLVSSELLGAFAAALAPDAEHYGVALGEPLQLDDEWRTILNEWWAKLDVVRDLRPEAVSFTFGSPSEAVCRDLTNAGILAVATVTTVQEALIALSFGVDALVVQGPKAGGHRATYSALGLPPDQCFDELVTALVVCFDCPVVAAGGVATPDDLRRLRDAGASAVQVGTAILLADEAGTNAVHRAALRDERFSETVLTRAFTGRYARALRNRFIDAHEADALFGFPHVAMMTAPLQAAALRRGDPHGVALWAGAAFHHARSGSATDIVRELAG
jgi:nitronate monooxygenase